MAALAKMAAVGIFSALIAYLFDPERGKGRRARAIDQAKSRMRRLQEAAERRMFGPLARSFERRKPFEQVLQLGPLRLAVDGAPRQQLGGRWRALGKRQPVDH